MLRILRYLCLATGLLLVVTATALAQQQSNAQAELQSRLQAATEARETGDPVVISQANRKLLAFALGQMADLQLLQGNAANAAEYYGKSLEFEEAADRRSQYVLALSAAGRVDAALQQTEILLQQNPDSAVALGMKGRLLTTKKNYQEAVDALNRSLAIQPDPEAAYVLAGDYLYLRQPEKAQVIFKQLQDAGISPARVHVMAGRACEEAGLPQDAEREYQKAIEIDPKSHGHYFLGLFYLSQNGWEATPKARAEFASEVANNPTDFFGNYFLGYLAANDKDYDTSDKYLKVAAQAKPDWPEPFLYMGLNAYGRGDNQTAEEYLRKAIQLTGSDEDRNNYQIRRAYFTLGRILIQTGRKEEGTKLVEKSKAMETKLVLEARPKALDQKAASGGSALQSAEVAGSSSTSAKPASLTPEQKTQVATAENTLSRILGSAYNDLGTSEARRQDYATALAHFEEAQHWNPETPGLDRNIGLAAFLAGNYAECVRVLPGHIEKEPSDRRSQSMLALSYYMLKNYPEAAKSFDRIPGEAMADPRMSYAWAFTLAQVKQTQRAAEILGKLTQRTELPADMFVRAGKLYADLGDAANAQACYNKARAQDPNIKVPR